MNFLPRHISNSQKEVYNVIRFLGRGKYSAMEDAFSARRTLPPATWVRPISLGSHHDGSGPADPGNPRGPGFCLQGLQAKRSSVGPGFLVAPSMPVSQSCTPQQERNTNLAKCPWQRCLHEAQCSTLATPTQVGIKTRAPWG